MGRITVFTADRCPHSRRLMKLLEQHGIPFSEINVTRHPDKLHDMIFMTGNFSTPQVFFNTRHVGGAREVTQVLKEWNRVNLDSSPSSKRSRRASTAALERFVREIEQHPDPMNPRLALPKTDPVPPQPKPERRRSAQYSISLPDGSKTTVVKVMETLKSVLPIAERKQSMSATVYRNCFTGMQLVDALMKQYHIADLTDAVNYAERLQDEQIVHSVHTISVQVTYSDELFRLQCYQTPDILNSYRIWTEPAIDTDPMRLLQSLAELLADIIYSATDDEGMIDYRQAPTVCPARWTEWEEAVCALQKVDISAMDDATKTAFGINLYNIMIKYAFMKVGIAQNSLRRNAFYNHVKFYVGDYVFSFQEWEHGILRGNRRAPYCFSSCFSKRDLRLPLAVEEPDYRLHFGLNCGARSCPPVNTYSVENLDQELQIAASSFCNDDANVWIDSSKREVHTSMLFFWYKSDFAQVEDDMIVLLLKHLRGSKHLELTQLASNSLEPIKLVHKEYDWSPFAKNFKVFDPALLKASKRSFKASEFVCGQ